MVSIEIPAEVYEKLMEEARRRGVSLEELVIEGLLTELDPGSRTEIYLRLHEKYLKEAEELYVKGNLAQAGEKYWGAVTALLNAVGEIERLPHYSHRDIKEITIYLTSREKDPEYTRLFSSVETLHANYYHNFLTRDVFDIHREDALKLINKLKNYISKNK